MPFEINERCYTFISNALKKATEKVNYNGIWLNFNLHYGIGERDGKFLKLSSSDRKKIAEITLSKTDLDPRRDNVCELTKMNRTEVAGISRFEKLLSIPPREKYVEIRILSESSHPPGYQGVLVESLILSKPNIVISVENFDTFSSLNLEDLPPFFQTTKPPITLLYVGDNKASPKAVSEIKRRLDSNWYHFGDFDPQGIMIGLRRMGVTKLIIPPLNDIPYLKSLSNTSLFRKQKTAYHFLLNNISRNKEILTSIGEYELAITQEVLVARKLKLHIIDFSMYSM